MSPSYRPRVLLLLIALVLIGHAALRMIEITALPVYVDEYSHITRAQRVYDFTDNPVRESHGKLLLYFWIGLFDPQSPATLPVARWPVALFSMVGAAAAAAAARDLFGRRAMLPALAFYALAPYALFFDRMALADPFAGALSAVAAWASIRLARRPTRTRGLWTGLLITCATLAKLTTGLIVALPLIAALLVAPIRPRGWTRTALRGWGRALWRCCHRAWIAAGAVFLVLWGVVIGAALLNRLAGARPYLMDTHLIESEATTNRLADKLGEVVERGDLLLSAPMSAGLVVLAAVLLWRVPRQGSYVLIWGALLWFPNIVIARTIQSRYLMIAVPAMAVLFGGGLVTLEQWISGLISRRWPSRHWTMVSAALMVVVIGVWALDFTLPFAHKALTDPAALTLSETDRYNYFRGVFNGWGSSQAIRYLLDHGQRAGGRLPVAAVLGHCGPPSIYVTEAIDWLCVSRFDYPDQRVPPDVRDWEPLTRQLERWGYVYLLTDYPEYVPLDAPPAVAGWSWSREFTFAHPFGGRIVAAWRVENEAASHQR